jgi:DNA-binding response OmpR family regulator
MSKILVVEDDEDMARVIVRALRDERHTVESTEDGREALELLALSQYDLVILDWALPTFSGVEIAHQYRAAGGTAGIIMLTGKSSLASKETGFNAGADDYVTKPVDMRELILHVRSLLKRPAVTASALLTHQTIELDPIKHKLLKSGKEVHLAPRDFALLEFFMRHPDQIFSADNLIMRVWQSDTGATGEAVRMAISRIRKQIDDEFREESLIESVPRVGYRLRRL